MGPALVGAILILGSARPISPQQTDPQQLFQEASEAQQRGDAALAVRKYQELLQLRPDLVAARVNLGLALVALGQFDEAIEQDRAALRQTPGDSELQANLGMAYYQKGDLPNAAREFGSLHDKEPGNIQIATLLGTCYMRLGRASEAVSVLSPLEKAHPDNPDLEWALGWALFRNGRTQEGFERAEKAAQQRNSADAYMLTAKAEVKFQAFDRARRNVAAAMRLNPHLPGLNTLSGIIMDNAGDYDGAATAFQRELDANPNDLEAHLHLGALFYHQRKLDAAWAHLERALEIEPTSSLARYELARVKRAQGQVEAAVKNLERVVRDRPEWIEPHVELAALYYRLNRPRDGEKEKRTVDRLAEQNRQRLSKSHDLSAQIPLP